MRTGKIAISNKEKRVVGWLVVIALFVGVGVGVNACDSAVARSVKKSEAAETKATSTLTSMSEEAITQEAEARGWTVKSYSGVLKDVIESDSDLTSGGILCLTSTVAEVASPLQYAALSESEKTALIEELHHACGVK